MEEVEAKRLFQKLKIRTLLDLALILPSSYEDTRLASRIEPGRVQTFEAQVEDRRIRGGRMQVRFFLPALGRRISGQFFKATPYHQRLFEPGSRHIIHGKVSLFNGWPQIAQPRSLKEYGRIFPRYKTVLKESQMRALIENYVTERNLFAEGLQSEEVGLLMRLHFLERYSEAGAPPPQIEGEVVGQLKFIEAYNHLRKLRSKRHDYPALKALNRPIEPFVETLPFTLTPDQQKVIAEIQKDLSQKEKAARRMIIGDVGSGKTMVILAAAVMAGGDRSVLMAPTSILARQLYEEACKYLPRELKVALVMQGNSEGDYREADFIIGTHALLYLEDLPEAALVMVDEQHRFGTKQRALLEALVSQGERRPHYLQFSATPIPRTQAMMESELIDVSLITQTPFEKEIHSRVIGRSDFPELLRHIEKELEEDHQVLIVYPLVEESEQIPYQSIDEARGFWEKRYEGVYVTHGRDRNKEEILLEFREQGKILLATTVIEVGISLPRLTTIVIVGAERLGLATLHQLRGRVGRNGLKSWCFLYTNLQSSERLEKFCRTKSGFEIARLDLAYRDSGDIVDGTIQSGQKFRWLDLAEDEEIVRRAKERLNNGITE
ncbi:ATP-dependent DNA helicase RecG [Nitratifractor salsuginis]|uniref:ATP-dependent DNA helicase RecG n=1 Tax=Nitratifractor salsuginis (strain DSM 16511 / JCM 12458 / E9I37-1) TaxID=749222 RepID=E6X1J1_NITSE|nr:ATP-dependent DNA helicase RecG [Nitratifractor salsuginis]ADV45924.1 ATP-dependent DNA helicase RecG [Nitratifractor salsuginis DSM 16511]